MDFNSIIFTLFGSTFGLILRLFIQDNLKINIGFNIQNTSVVNFIASFFLGILVASNFTNKTKEIILSSNTSLYSFPEVNAKKLLVLDIGTTLSVLRNWQVSESEIWVRVELASNKFLDDPNKIKKGWIKM